jgi:hypothetical protein
MVLILLLILLAMVPAPAEAQQVTVTLLPVSVRMSDEYAPVPFEDGLLFCSNRPDNGVVAYSGGQKPVYRMFVVSGNGAGRWNTPRLLSGSLVSGMNDGPATWCEKDSTLYFSRNSIVSRSLRNIDDPSNKLGIFTAVFRNGMWTVPEAFPHNDARYSLTTPSVTPDGNRLYFASDRPGGMGNLDLYYCDREGGRWSAPVNLGPAVNTPGNDLFPFAAAHDRLYFASDGREGLGGKDIYYTVQVDGRWISPVHLDSAINSEADDFGLVTDSTFCSGYFSSNRRKSDDIYAFKQAAPVFGSCDSIRPNRYCFTFYDERQVLSDTGTAEYRWDFGDGIIRTGKEAGYCFPGPGTYTVKLRITDAVTGREVAAETTYDVQLDAVQQGIIHSVDLAVEGQPVSFLARLDQPGNSHVAQYFWNTGEGFTAGGSECSAVFPKKGSYTVEVGMLVTGEGGEDLREVCVKKTIRVLDREPEVLQASSNQAIAGESGNESFPVFIAGGTGLPELRKEYGNIMPPFTEGLFDFSHFEPEASSLAFIGALAQLLQVHPDWQADILIFTSGGEGLSTASRYAAALRFAMEKAGAGAASFRCDGYTSRERTSLFPEHGDKKGAELVIVISKKG